jgi:YidC/Oxa1 family membrane protein insertase
MVLHFWFTPSHTRSIPSSPTTPLATLPSKPIHDPSSSQEAFYLLETQEQQLLFSTVGGALVEINLPLQSAEHPQSIVKEIDIDRRILKNSPRNARFPLHAYWTASTDGTPLFHAEGKEGGYYPLLRRPLLHRDGSPLSTIPAEYFACNIVGEDPEIASLIYKVTRFEPHLIQFQAKRGSGTITKTFSIPQERNGPYCLHLDVTFEGETGPLWLTSGVPDVELVGGSYNPLLRYRVPHGYAFDVETVSFPKKEPLEFAMLHPDWVSNSNGFLGLIITPLLQNRAGYRVAPIRGDLVPTRLSVVDPGYALYPPENYPGYMTYLPLGPSNSFRLFAGPFDESLLKELDALYDEPLKNYNPEYTAAQSIQGWFSFISEPFARFLFLLMQIFYTFTRSWALSIVLLTFAIRAMMYPLNAWSIRSSLKLQKLAPQVRALQEKYKKDPMKARLETMNLYKAHGANPLTGGCLPLLLSMPFFIGIFYLLKSSFPLRGAPFIPGWIDDLAAPDVLFTWGQPLWFIGNEFHLLPLLGGLTMYLQMQFNSTIPKNAKELTDEQRQQKIMGIFLPILLSGLFYHFPSGFNIYSILATLLGVAQQWWMTHQRRKSSQPEKA